MMPGRAPVPQGAAHAPHGSPPQWQAQSPGDRAPRLSVWSSCSHTPKAMTNCHLNGPLCSCTTGHSAISTWPEHIGELNLHPLLGHRMKTVPPGNTVGSHWLSATRQVARRPARAQAALGHFGPSGPAACFGPTPTTSPADPPRRAWGQGRAGWVPSWAPCSRRCRPCRACRSPRRPRTTRCRPP